MITTSTFSPEAKDYVQKIEKKIVLIDGKQLAQLMIEHDVGGSDACGCTDGYLAFLDWSRRSRGDLYHSPGRDPVRVGEARSRTTTNGTRWESSAAIRRGAV